PERIERQVAFLRDHPEIDVLATRAEFIDGAGEPVCNDWTARVRRQHDHALDEAAISALLPLTCCLTHGSIMARASVVRAAGGLLPILVRVGGGLRSVASPPPRASLCQASRAALPLSHPRRAGGRRAARRAGAAHHSRQARLPATDPPRAAAAGQGGDRSGRR